MDHMHFMWRIFRLTVFVQSIETNSLTFGDTRVDSSDYTSETNQQILSKR